MYEVLVATGKMPPPMGVTERADGSKLVKVFPWGNKQALFGITLELAVEKGKDVSQSNPLQAPPQCVGILGAGNYDSILEVITCLFLENS